MTVQRVREQLLLQRQASYGAGVRIAVLDTGIDADHPDLAGRLDLDSSRAFTVVDDLFDRNGHGTHVAGIIVGTGTDSNGVYRGIAPEATVVAYKVAGSQRGLEASAAAAIGFALEAKVDIINFSHGHVPKVHPPPWIWPAKTNALEDAFLAAHERGVLCVVAAGNAGPYAGSVTRPGGLSEVLTVGAVGLNGRVSPASSRGPFRRSASLRQNQTMRYDPQAYPDALVTSKPDVVVPGEQVTSLRSGHVYDQDQLDDNPRYVPMSGSSQAAAVATGLAALLLSLSKAHKIDLGANPGQTLHRLMTRAASKLTAGDSADFGSGTLKWPMLQTTLSDFSKDPQFRESVLHPEMRLL